MSFKDRVKKERRDLEEKTAKLEAFIDEIPIHLYDISDREEYRLKMQLVFMELYLRILDDRIDADFS